MNEAKPEDLYPHRVYFTALDRTTYSQVAWSEDDVDNIIRSLTRTIKLLALTKGHIVIAASHLLESELAREIILKYPDLIIRRIVIPALRDDFTSVAEFREAKKNTPDAGEASLYAGPEQSEISELIDSEGLVVRWNSQATSGWFKERLIHDLRDEKSLVRSHLSERHLSSSGKLCQELQDIPALSRGAIYLATQKYGDLEFREIVNSYADFLYYLGGAKAVQSEGVLPQENIIDFGLHDFETSWCPLSENEIFTKLFLDSVKAATSTHFPEDLLDALDLPDIFRLHDVAIKESFIEKYNTIQATAKAALKIEDSERLVLLMNELLEFESELHKSFMSAIRNELPAKLRELQRGHIASLLHSLANFLILPYGAATGLKDIVISGLRVIKQDALAKDIQERVDHRLRIIRGLASRIFGGEKPTLLNFIEDLKNQYMDRLKGNF